VLFKQERGICPSQKTADANDKLKIHELECENEHSHESRKNLKNVCGKNHNLPIGN
jgi:hypothetical protein